MLTTPPPKKSSQHLPTYLTFLHLLYGHVLYGNLPVPACALK